MKTRKSSYRSPLRQLSAPRSRSSVGKPPKSRPAEADSATALQALSTVSPPTSIESLTVGGVERLPSRSTQEPVPLSVTQPSHKTTSMPEPQHDFSSSIQIGSLIRKRKLERMKAVEAITRLEEEEEQREIEFQRALKELQGRRVELETSLGAKRVRLEGNLQHTEFPSEPASSSTATPHDPQIPEIGLENGLQFPNNNINSINILPVDNSINQLAQALTQAIKMSNGNEEMKRFAARQTHSRPLTPFYGDTESWPGFMSEFTSSNEECQYSNVENMLRLKDCLRGRAMEAVKSMLIVPENVNQVIQTLKMNFGRPELIISTLMNKLRRLPKAENDKFESLLPLSNSLANLVSTIQILGEIGHLVNPQLLSEIEDKLPPCAKVLWAQARFHIDERVTLTHLSKWLQDLCNSMSRIGSNRESESRHRSTASKYESRSDSHHRRHHSDTTNRESISVMAITDKSDEAKHFKCLFCSVSEHDVTKCQEFQKQKVDARWDWAKKNRVCFCCLRKGHQVSTCNQRNGRKQAACGVGGCKKAHHRLLHMSTEDRETPASTVGHIGQHGEEVSVLLKVVPVKLKGPAKEISTFAFLDDGSGVTLLDKNLADEIGATGPTKRLKLRWTDDKHVAELDSTVTSIIITGADGQPHVLDDVKAITNLNLKCQSVDVKEMSETWTYLQEIDPRQLEQGQPKILIGQRHWDLLQTLEVIRGPSNAPALSKTKLGWVLHGVVPNLKGRIDENLVMCHWQSDADSKLCELVKKSMSTEEFGVKALSQLPKSKLDTRAQKIMDETTKDIGKRFETGLLWKTDNPQLPESKPTAVKRLFSLENKMDRDEQYATKYCAEIDKILIKGFAKKLDPAAAAITTPRTWLLPHFGVTNPNKPGKLRVVFDAAAKSHGKSLNDFLLLGPDLLRPLASVLFKFRLRRIAFGGDIREMFPQVKIREEDRCAQRFLWRGMDRTKPPDVYEFSSAIFGAASSPFQVQEIKNRNALRFIEQAPTAVNAIINYHYMDDYWDSTDTEKEAIPLISDVNRIHSEGGFEMVNWVSNSKEVEKSIPKERLANGDGNFEFGDMPSERVLGVHWNRNLDVFTFLLKFHRLPQEIVNGTRRPTKREILKLVAAIFDPLGFIAHFIVRAKILLQDIWRLGLGWDDQVTEEIFLKWKTWLSELSGILELQIPRCYSILIPTATSIQLHIFTDASEKAFSAAAYFRVEMNQTQVHTSLVMAKTRVAPLKSLSIPRLELQAAVMGSRLSQTIVDGHDIKISEIHFWSDSLTVLKWIRSDSRRYNAFVAHRIGEILETTEPESWKCWSSNWHWISTDQNVADEATRDGPGTDTTSNSRWLTGPEFLKFPPSEWPKEMPRTSEDEKLADKELKAEFVGATFPVGTSFLPNPERFSNWMRLIRSTAWILRVRNRKKFPDTKFSLHLTLQELEEAEQIWFRQIQIESFPIEYNQMLHEDKKKTVLPSSSRLLNLSPFMENKIIRCRGRTSESEDLAYDTKNPIILDPKHCVTRLLIEHHHRRVNHHGQGQVMNDLRQRFWILSLRSAVRSVWNSCQWCRLRRSKPQQPVMAPLPSIRVNRPLRAFINTGIDFFGPLEVKVGRKREKRYGVILVCLSTRAVHLELASSLTTESTLLAIQRFIAMRAPEKIYSDNGRNFKGASREVREVITLLDHGQIQEQLAMKKIEWRFIPPAAPNMAGSWESLIKSVKISLNATLKEQAPREDVLRTVFAEVQGIINGHPLTEVPVDPNDKESLTPNHFLIGSSSDAIPRVYVDSSRCLHQQWKFSQALADSFWKRWIREYLPTLTRRLKWHQTTRNAVVGDLVLIADNNLPRNHWPRGYITGVFPGKDGVIRVVDVQTNMGKYRRPMSRICLLDIRMN